MLSACLMVLLWWLSNDARCSRVCWLYRAFAKLTLTGGSSPTTPLFDIAKTYCAAFIDERLAMHLPVDILTPSLWRQSLAIQLLR